VLGEKLPFETLNDVRRYLKTKGAQASSYWRVEDRKHQREIETMLIRAAGPLLPFNEKKKQLTIDAGSIGDYEANTRFFERHYKKGKKPYRKKSH